MSGDEARGGCQERRDDLAAYSLGALDPGQAAELERHLAGCPACAERLRWLRPAADLVPASVRQFEPSPRLRTELMATVRAEAAQEAAAEPATAAGGPERSRPGPFARFRERLLGDGPLRPALAGFAVACLLVAGVAGYELGHDGGSGPEPATYAALPVSPDSNAHGTVEVTDGSGTLTVSEMRPIPDDEVYQAWIAHGSKVEPSSIFVVDGTGHGSASLPSIPSGTDRVMVTREPAGGSQRPSTAPVLTAEL